MIEAFYLAIYLLVLSPILFYFGIDSPLAILGILVLLSLPGIYAMVSGAPYVPTLRKTTDKMLKVADIKPGDIIYDLGCGDGRFIFRAAKLGAHAIGYELSVPLYIFAKFKSIFIRNATIRYGNFWNQSYEDADIIFCFLLVKTTERLEKEIWPKLKPGAKVISHSFKLPNKKPVFDEEGIKMYVKN